MQLIQLVWWNKMDALHSMMQVSRPTIGQDGKFAKTAGPAGGLTQGRLEVLRQVRKSLWT